MFIFFGVRTCGRVDEVPGRFHVATRFLHLYWAPLIPVGTRLFVAAGPKRPVSVRIPFSVKSAAVAYLQAMLVFLGALSVATAMVFGAGPPADPVAFVGWLAVAALIFTVAFAGTRLRGVGRATAARAWQISRALETHGHDPAELQREFSRALRDARVEWISLTWGAGAESTLPGASPDARTPR